MNKKEFIAAVAVKANKTKKETAEMIDATLEALTEGLAAESRVALSGFGTFEAIDVEARDGVNPQNGDPIEIPAHKRVKFKPSQHMKDVVNA